MKCQYHALGLPSHRNCEANKSVLYKLSSLWYSVIAAENGKSTPYIFVVEMNENSLCGFRLQIVTPFLYQSLESELNEEISGKAKEPTLSFVIILRPTLAS